MDSQQKETLIVDPILNEEAEIGRWLWALQETRQRTLRLLKDITPEMVDWQTPMDESSIGTILYHLTDIEADWLYVEVLERDLPQEVADMFPYPTRDHQGHLTQVTGISLAQHLKRLQTVRGLLLDAYQHMKIEEFHRLRSLEHYDVTPEWVLHHLMQHEAEHRGQIGAMRTRWELETDR